MIVLLIAGAIGTLFTCAITVYMFSEKDILQGIVWLFFSSLFIEKWIIWGLS